MLQEDPGTDIHSAPEGKGVENTGRRERDPLQERVVWLLCPRATPSDPCH